MDDKIHDHSSSNGSGMEKEYREKESREEAETFEKREELARGIFDIDAFQNVSGTPSSLL